MLLTDQIFINNFIVNDTICCVDGNKITLTKRAVYKAKNLPHIYCSIKTTTSKDETWLTTVNNVIFFTAIRVNLSAIGYNPYTTMHGYVPHQD